MGDRIPRPFTLVETDPRWRKAAACATADPEVFFESDIASRYEARRVCEECPIKDDCLQWALDNPKAAKFGIWAGTSEDERARMRAERGR